MSTRNWVIGIIVVIVVVAAGYVVFKPAGEMSMMETQAPAATEQPAGSAQSGDQDDEPQTTGTTGQTN
jgi:hypothetical protein